MSLNSAALFVISDKKRRSPQGSVSLNRTSGINLQKIKSSLPTGEREFKL